MDVTVFGITNLSMPEHLANMFLLIVVNDFGSTIERRPVHPSKAKIGFTLHLFTVLRKTVVSVTTPLD